MVRLWYMPQIPFVYAANTIDICGIYELHSMQGQPADTMSDESKRIIYIHPLSYPLDVNIGFLWE